MSLSTLLYGQREGLKNTRYKHKGKVRSFIIWITYQDRDHILIQSVNEMKMKFCPHLKLKKTHHGARLSPTVYLFFYLYSCLFPLKLLVM